MSSDNIHSADLRWVKESDFGVWFLNTDIWVYNVLRIALDDLERIMHPKLDRYPTVLDIGCGHGHSLVMLDRRFKPDKIYALDVDPRAPEWSEKNAASCVCSIEFMISNAASISLPDASVDMVFCHQSFHHIVDQTAAAKEFFRVLKPGAVLLFAESCKKYIHSLPIRILFRHPMDVQKTDMEYIRLLQSTGFVIDAKSVSRPYRWWSRMDLGLLELLGKKVPSKREETLVNLAAYKPAL